MVVQCLLVMMRTVDRMTDKIRPVLDEFEAPSWFKWCFDHNHIPENLKGHPVVEPIHVLLVIVITIPHQLKITISRAL